VSDDRNMTPDSHDQVTLEDLLGRMWSDYVRLNPLARRIHDLLRQRGENVVNDHIALRTFDLPRVDLEVLARPFVERGYVERAAYAFPEKSLVARHFEAQSPGLPKVFISQLRVGVLPRKAAELIASLVDAIPDWLPSRPDFCLAGRAWPLSFAQYRELLPVSDYAAWVAAFGFRPNHFTVDVNALRTVASLGALNELLKENGFALNSSGGEIKGSPAELLEQSSTLANLVEVEFADGPHSIPACYYEFARRYPGRDGRLYQGFIAASANKIFESTARGQALGR
jgi:hypothetical protein